MPAQTLQGFLDTRAVRRKAAAPPQAAPQSRCRTRCRHDPADHVDADRLRRDPQRDRPRRRATSPTRIVTTSPDVTVSTNLGPWVNRRGLFAREQRWPTRSRASASPRPSNGSSSPNGQHIELGIAEMNLFILLSALGLSHSINGERLLPIGTLYDPFIARGLDALNYACYQDARFILVATPSGITLAPRRRRASVDRHSR